MCLALQGALVIASMFLVRIMPSLLTRQCTHTSRMQGPCAALHALQAEGLLNQAQSDKLMMVPLLRAGHQQCLHGAAGGGHGANHLL